MRREGGGEARVEVHSLAGGATPMMIYEPIEPAEAVARGEGGVGARVEAHFTVGAVMPMIMCAPV